VVAHEVLHTALTHHARRGQRDAERWNIACDLAVNPLLLEAGFTLPASRLVPGEGSHTGLPSGLSAEEYYALLSEESPGRPVEEGAGADQPEEKGDSDDGQGQNQGDGPGQDQGQNQPAPDPGGCGGVRDPGRGSPAESRQSEAEWQVALAQAQQVARQRGTLPAGLARLVQETLQPRLDWREVLRRFLSSQARNDFSWSDPNRRFLHAGLYLPGLRSEELGEVVLAVDTSGSIGPKELSLFAAEAQAILESFDCFLTILYHDSAVQHVQRWRSGDGLCSWSPQVAAAPVTSVFEWVARRRPA
jgi:predicted metal-dependent peptidase